MRLSMGKAPGTDCQQSSSMRRGQHELQTPALTRQVIELVAKIPEWERLFCAIAFMAWLAERLA
jgi:hypothetical protein